MRRASSHPRHDWPGFVRNCANFDVALDPVGKKLSVGIAKIRNL